MPTGPTRILAFVHPVLALAVLLFLAWVASLGLRARDRRAAHLRRRHARLARFAYGAMLANFVFGVLSAWLLRPDLDEARTSAHFRLALVIVAILSITAWLSRRVATNDTARLLHPMLGLLALVLSVLQIFFGMPILPL